MKNVEKIIETFCYIICGKHHNVSSYRENNSQPVRDNKVREEYAVPAIKQMAAFQFVIHLYFMTPLSKVVKKKSSNVAYSLDKSRVQQLVQRTR